MKDGAAHMWRYWCLGTQPYVPCPATAMWFGGAMMSAIMTRSGAALCPD